MALHNKKTPKDSLAIATDLVLPSETNQMGGLFGGELLARLDRIAYISACRHAGISTVVTGAVNNVSFGIKIPLGSIVTLESKVSRSFNSSMEVIIDVWIEDIEKNTKKKANEAIYTFIAIDENKNTVKVPEIHPQTDLEKERYQAALRRRQLSLVLARKLAVEDASELKALFK